MYEPIPLKDLPSQQPVGFQRPTELRDIDGLYETLSTAPTHTPRNSFEQIKLYKSGTTYRLYMYDCTNNAWRYINLT